MESEHDLPISIEWHFLCRYPPRYLNAPRFIEMFRRWIQERAEVNQGFEENLRQASLYAITANDPGIVRRGLQCLASVGHREDVLLLTKLLIHGEPLVVRDVKTCIFEIEHRSRAD